MSAYLKRIRVPEHTDDEPQGLYTNFLRPSDLLAHLIFGALDIQAMKVEDRLAIALCSLSLYVTMHVGSAYLIQRWGTISNVAPSSLAACAPRNATLFISTLSRSALAATFRPAWVLSLSLSILSL